MTRGPDNAKIANICQHLLLKCHLTPACPRHGLTHAARQTMQVARSGRFLLAGMGQEPRLGRWARDKKARNGLLLHRLALRDE